MLTGHAVFDGDTVGEILGGVFKAEPDWHRLPTETPDGIRRLLRRCLRKERKQRLQYIGDARVEIEEARSETEPVGQPAVPTISRSRERLGWIIAMTIVIGVMWAAPYFHAPVELPQIRTDIVTPPTPDPISFALSPDGRRLVFVAGGKEQPQLYLRQLDAVGVQPLSGTEGAQFLVSGQPVGRLLCGRQAEANRDWRWCATDSDRRHARLGWLLESGRCDPIWNANSQPASA